MICFFAIISNQSVIMRKSTRSKCFDLSSGEKFKNFCVLMLILNQIIMQLKCNLLKNRIVCSHKCNHHLIQIKFNMVIIQVELPSYFCSMLCDRKHC